MTSMSSMGTPWWQEAVIYQIYPRSFSDADGNGVGDLQGIRRHLDHLAWLGVDAIWISPFFTSPMADYGYDVADYCDVDPLFGSLADFDRLLEEAHRLGLRVLIDWVPNHSSDQHPWFLESLSGPSSPRRDWYYWREGAGPGRPPNNWRAAFIGGPAWTWDPRERQWYLHSFLPQQPDLNWGNPAVAAAMHDTLRFWLDRGVDGFRIDVVHLIGKDPDLPDGPGRQPAITDRWITHALLRDMRSLLDSYPGQRTSVGEVYILDTAEVASYYGQNDELHMAFNFPPLLAPWEAGAWRQCINETLRALGPRGAWPTWVLSNHDTPRHRTRYGSEARARAAAVLLLSLRGTPFLYAGEELGLEDAVVNGEDVRDPGGRDGCRAPVPWTSGSGHGWPVPPWLPWPPDPDVRNAEALSRDPDGILHLYRRLLALRRAREALRVGDLTLLDCPEGVLGYRRSTSAEELVVLVNFSATVVEVDVAGGPFRIELSGHSASESGPWEGRLGADQAVILGPQPEGET
ncbi:MAG TPA: alpha-amylase family glycosyl hydrolase [Acidimicrobiales bacterium]|nr:alpha-amylase family glycosyl hydrolase [Acidimicrobiales bacterium]